MAVDVVFNVANIKNTIDVHNKKTVIVLLGAVEVALKGIFSVRRPYFLFLGN